MGDATAVMAATGDAAAVGGGERIEGGEGHRDGKGSTALEKAGEAVVRKAGGTERGGAVPDDDDDDGDMFEEEDARSSSLAAASSDLLLESGHHHHHQLAAHPSMANPRIAAASLPPPPSCRPHRSPSSCSSPGSAGDTRPRPCTPTYRAFFPCAIVEKMKTAGRADGATAAASSHPTAGHRGLVAPPGCPWRWTSRGDRPGLRRSASSITDAAHPIPAADREGRRSWRSSSSSEARGSSSGFPRPSSASFSRLLGRSVPELAHAATPPPSPASSSPPPRHRLPMPSSPPAGRPAGLPVRRERERGGKERKGVAGLLTWRTDTWGPPHREQIDSIPGWKKPSANLPRLDTSSLWLPDNGRSAATVSAASANTTALCSVAMAMTNRQGGTRAEEQGGAPELAIVPRSPERRDMERTAVNRRQTF
uniref:Uncharacterized protein n=1 Tax=Oryza glumipatula TaxID=40148 RepID=A0A0D9YI06_9ORYZ